MLVNDYILLPSDLHHDLGVQQHPHDQLDHDQTPKHGFLPSPDHGVENQYRICFTYFQLNSSLLLSKRDPKARPETQTKNYETRNPENPENPRPGTTIDVILCTYVAQQTPLVK